MDAQSSQPPGFGPLLTPLERCAEKELRAATSGQYRIFTQVKLSRVISQRPPGLSDDAWAYATRAEFDFVVCDKTTLVPEFAVEFDDPTHRRQERRSHDQLKDRLCEARGLELLRIGCEALQPAPRGRRLVEYLVDARSFALAFQDAQACGAIPADEICDYRLTLELGRNGLDFVNDLAAPARQLALRLHRRGKIADGWISAASFYRDDGWAQGWAWLRYTPNLYLFRTAEVRAYRFFCGIGPGELAEDLAVAEVGAHLGTDDVRLISARDLQKLVDDAVAHGNVEPHSRLHHLRFVRDDAPRATR